MIGRRAKNTLPMILWSFTKLGAFSFGGGYGMIPLIRVEIVESRRSHYAIKALRRFRRVIFVAGAHLGHQIAKAGYQAIYFRSFPCPDLSTHRLCRRLGARR